MKINDYQRLIKEVNKIDKNKGIAARINPKAKKIKKGKRRR